MNKPDFPTEEQGQVIQLLAKCERLEARVAELGAYAMHKRGCGLEALGVCDCGLSALLSIK